jgi:hypothetical protein
MTKQDALNLAYGQVIYHTSLTNRDGSPLRARVSGKPVVRVRTGSWRVPLTYGLRTYFSLDASNINNWLLQEPTK